MKRSTKLVYGRECRSIRRAMHYIDHPNIRTKAPDPHTEKGTHLERHIHSTQNLDNPGVPRPAFVKQLDGKTVRYVGP